MPATASAAIAGRAPRRAPAAITSGEQRDQEQRRAVAVLAADSAVSRSAIFVVVPTVISMTVEKVATSRQIDARRAAAAASAIRSAFGASRIRPGGPSAFLLSSPVVREVRRSCAPSARTLVHQDGDLEHIARRARP